MIKMVNLSKQELNGYIEDISKLISHEEFELSFNLFFIYYKFK